MPKKIFSLLIMLLLAPLTCWADLTGVWRADDGGTYYLRQVDNMVHWYGEENATSPRWSNVFHGKIRGNQIRGTWMDVPKGRTMSRGELSLRIMDNGRVLEAVRKTGGFGGSRWVRADTRRMPHAAPPMQQRHTMAPPPPMQRVREDCISFNSSQLRVEEINGHWKITEGSHWLFDFGRNQQEARSAYRIIRHYRMDQSCFVGRPNPSFSYLLSNRAAPAGSIRGEDCIGFNPARLKVEAINGHWKITEGSHWLFDFGNNEREARQALALIHRHGFTRSCYVGRPHPSFKYLRK